MSHKRVLITGFGPFPNVETNPSWEGVNCMNREEIQSKYDISFYQEMIEVEYNVIDASLPKLWSKLQPDLTIHVGVKDKIDSFKVETQAAKGRYVHCDITGKCPEDGNHSTDGPESICTDLNVDQLCEEFNQSSPVEELRAEKSDDAGKYLCEYIYYASLTFGSGSAKTLFVHVPLQPLFTYEQIAQGLERILEICLKQLRDE